MIRSKYIHKLDSVNQLEGSNNPLVIHAKGELYQHILEGKLEFFEKFNASAESRGYTPLLVHAEELLSDVLRETDLLQIAVGPRQLQGKNLFHAHPSYILGFWYLDTKGYYWNSTINDLDFNPEQVDIAQAEYFYNGVSGYFTRHNVSLRPQHEKVSQNLPSAEAMIPLQNIETYRQRIYYLTSEEIITTVCNAVSGRVYVKLHPLHSPVEQEKFITFCAQFPNAEISEASIHDLIDASDVVVSQNSAVGFEAFMYKKPVLTCAKCDYHHGSLVCRTTDELRANLRRAPDYFGNFTFEKYFYWFLGQHMLEPQKHDFANRAWVRILTE